MESLRREWSGDVDLGDGHCSAVAPVASPATGATAPNIHAADKFY